VVDPKEYHIIQLAKATEGLTSMSQGGLDFWLQRVIVFWAGRQLRFLIVSVSLSGSKRGPQAHRQRIRWRPGVAKTSSIESFCLRVPVLCL